MRSLTFGSRAGLQFAYFARQSASARLRPLNVIYLGSMLGQHYFVYLSSQEGFGFPPLKAMACGGANDRVAFVGADSRHVALAAG